MDMREEIERLIAQHMPAAYEGTPAAELAAADVMALLPPELEEGWLEENKRMRQAITEEIMPEVMALWLRKNDDYAGQQVFLGRMAQFADINRKFWKLKQAMWDGKQLGFESPVEIMMDMIGHLLMAIYMEGQVHEEPVNMNELPGMWEEADLIGGATDQDG